MQPIDNGQFTEEQRAEAYRLESMQQMQRQTKALESIRGILVFFLIIFIVGCVAGILMLAGSTTGM